MIKPKSKLGLIGAGYWGKNLARNFNSLGVLHTICDLNPDVLERKKELYPDLPFTTDSDELLNNPDITRVAIATGAEGHYGLVRKALLAGKDVYVEKPFCLSVEEGHELVNLAKEGELILMVGHLLHYHPCVHMMFDLLDQGRLGDIEYIASNRLGAAAVMGSEGALWDLAPHDISIILSLCRPANPVHVQGQMASNSHLGLIAMQFDNNVHAHIHVSRISPYKEQTLTVVGTEATIIFDDTAPWEEKLTLYRRAEPQVAERVSVKKSEPLFEECAHFLHCCDQRTTPVTDGEQGLRVIQVLEAAYPPLVTA